MSWEVIREAVIWIVGGAATIVGYLLLAKDMATLQIPTYALIAFGNILFLLVFLRAFARQRKEILKNAETDFYGLNTQAKLERAHHIFYKLYNTGVMYKNGSPDLRHEWDRNVQRELRNHCNNSAISVYLSNTGRFNPGTETQAPQGDKYDTALEFIKNLLDRDFQGYLKI